MALLIFLYHLLLLQTLDSNNPSGFFLSAQPHLAKRTPPYNTYRLKTSLAHLLPLLPQFLHFLLKNIFFSLLLLLNGQVQLPDLLLKDLPVESPLLIFDLVEIILPLDISLDLLRPLPGSLTDDYLRLHILSVKNSIKTSLNKSPPSSSNP